MSATQPESLPSVETQEQTIQALLRDPHNSEIQEKIIGGLLLDPGNVFKVCAERLEPAAFSDGRYRAIYRAILRIAANRQLPPDDPEPLFDIFSIRKDLADHGELEQAGGPEMLTYIIRNLPPTALATNDHTRRLRNDHELAALATAGFQIAKIAGDRTQEASAARSAAYRVLQDNASASDTASFVDMSEIVADYLTIKDADPRADYIPTGITDLDERIIGIKKGELTIVGARPGIGKSSLAGNIALWAAIHGASAGIYSLELTKESMGHRAIAAYTDIPYQNFAVQRATDAEQSIIVNAVGVMSELDLSCAYHPNADINDIINAAQARKHQYGLDLLIVDYLQLAHRNMDTGPSRRNSAAVMSEITSKLARFAKTTNTAVLACSQLNRGAEHAPPSLAHLKESGSIEEDADLIILLHREAVPEGISPGRANVMTTFSIAKARNRSLGIVNVWYNPQTMTFHNEVRKAAA